MQSKSWGPTVNEGMLSFKGEPCDEKPVEYVNVTINTENNLSDHYNVLEKLGV